MRVYKRKIDLTGKRQGKLTILTPVGGGGWMVRCDCGKTYHATLSALIGYYRPGIRSCMACREVKTPSVRVPGGQTIAQLAKASGLKLDTVYHRFIRGWPRHLLAQETFPKGGKRRKVA